MTTEPGASEAALLTPRKVALQIIGFAIGLALLGWCISIAIEGEGWRRVTRADPRLVAGLVACSLVSLFANGASFWVVVRPLHRLRFGHLQWLNLVAAVLNYAPIRLGFIARIAYHLRVDRMPLVHLGAMFAALGSTLALTLGACIVATVAWPRFDLVWCALAAGQIILGGALMRAIMAQPLVLRYGRGMEQMLSRPGCLWGAIGLRIVDVAAFVGRMACAAAILDLALSTPDVILLGLAALALGLNPLGRVGFREIAVAFVASRLTATDMSQIQLEDDMTTLALVESAGEAMVSIPLGAVALLWYRRRWRAAARSKG